MSKKSIRFFNDPEVRAVWEDENNCWWFFATDVVYVTTHFEVSLSLHNVM